MRNKYSSFLIQVEVVTVLLTLIAAAGIHLLRAQISQGYRRFCGPSGSCLALSSVLGSCSLFKVKRAKLSY